MNTTLDSDGVEEKIHGLDTQRLQLTFKAQQTQKKWQKALQHTFNLSILSAGTFKLHFLAHLRLVI